MEKDTKRRRAFEEAPSPEEEKKKRKKLLAGIKGAFGGDSFFEKIRKGLKR